MKVRMIIICDLKQAATIEDVLKGTAAVLEVGTYSGKVSPSGHAAAYVGGIKNKGITARDYVITLLEKHGSLLPDELAKYASEKNFAKSSLINAANRLVRDKELERAKDGRYTID